MIYYYRMDPPLCSGGPLPHSRFTLPTARERRLSMPEIGKKERNYLFKEVYKLKSNDLMSSLRSQSPLEYPQTHSPSFPLCPVRGTLSQKKKNRSPGSFSAQATWSQKRRQMAAAPGFKSQRQSSSATSFLIPPTIGRSCQHSCSFPALLGCHSKSRQVWPCGLEPIISKLLRRLCNQGELPPSYILVEVTPIPLAQSTATAV